MDCERLRTITGWDCKSAGVNSIRAISPLTFGEDGQHLAYYIAMPTETTFFLTDASEGLMYAEQLGIEVSRARFESLSKTYGVINARFDSEGSIVAEGHINDLRDALWDCVKLSLAVSYASQSWRPKYDQSRFRDIVVAEFTAQLGAQRVLTSVRVKGMSGHLIEFPVGVVRNDKSICYVQPIALSTGSIDWPKIWQAHGKFFDLIPVSDDENRLAVIEDGAPTEEYGRAATFLTHSASVKTLAGTKDWEQVFA